MAYVIRSETTLKGDLDITDRKIYTTTTDGNIEITPDGTGQVVLAGNSFPNLTGSAAQYLRTDGSGNLDFFYVDSLRNAASGDFALSADTGRGTDNSLTVYSDSVGNDPAIGPIGSETNIGLNLETKGTGTVQISGISYPNTDGNAGQILETDGSGTVSFVDRYTWTVVSSNTTVSVDQKVLVDTSGGTVTVTLPASPSLGDEIWFADSASNWGTNAVTVDGNGNNILASSTYSVNTNDSPFSLVFNGTQWILGSSS